MLLYNPSRKVDVLKAGLKSPGN